MLVWAGQESLQRAIDQFRVDPVHGVPAQAHPFQRAGAEILQQHVGLADHVMRDRQAFGGLQVQAQAALVAVEIRKEPGRDPTQLARAVPVRRQFHADDVRPQIAQHQPAGRAHDGVREFEDHKPR